MKFGPVPLEEANGKLLGHNLAGPDGKRLFRKGRPLTSEDVQALRQMGKQSVYVAELEAGDVPEDMAALRIAEALLTDGLRLSRSAGGRVNLLATRLGVLGVDAAALRQANSCEGITLATLPAHAVARPRQIIATVKVIPYAVPEALLHQVEAAIAASKPLISLRELPPKRVGVILSGSSVARPRLLADFEAPLRKRIEALGSSAELKEFISLEDEGDEIALEACFSKRLPKACTWWCWQARPPSRTATTWRRAPSYTPEAAWNVWACQLTRATCSCWLTWARCLSWGRRAAPAA